MADTTRDIVGGDALATSQLRKPLRYAGTLDGEAHRECTPAIGREYVDLQVRDVLGWGDEKVRDLAVTSMLSNYLHYRNVATPHG